MAITRNILQVYGVVLLVLCSNIGAPAAGVDGRLVMDYGVNRRALQQVEDSSTPRVVVMVEVLGELKRAINSDPLGVLDSWDVDNSSAAVDPCRDKWSGLTCDQQGLELLAINLSGKQLRGTLTPSLSLLPFTSLTSLDLSQNNLSLSSDFSNLSSLIPPSLTLLNLSYTGYIASPHQLSTLLMIDGVPRSQLQHLWLDGLQLSGSLPQHLGHTFTSLLTLSLSHNSLTGPLPAAPASLSFQSLQRLDLSHNNLSGTLPASSWCGSAARTNLSTSLTFLDLSYNTLQGIIPTTLANCSALRHLDLSYNSLWGTIPAALPLSCRNLTFFSVVYNTFMLSGSLPPEFALLSRLESLLLEGNNFSGSPLPILLNCSALRTIHFYENAFEGRIPSDFCTRLPNLEDLVLGNNSFSGPLPPTLANCSSFTNLMLGFNKFSGSISGETLGKWTQLQRQLDLQYNSFTGSIPTQIGNLTNLVILILNNNYFSGSFPQEMGLLSSLKGATFEHNSFSGNFPGQIFNCTSLMHLIIHDNNLQGPLPSSIGQATQLSYLEAQNNLLIGSLPEALSNCTMLQNFSLGYNYFTGSIPGYLASVPDILFLFDLSHNNFSGVIPTGFGHMMHMQSLDLSHNKLSGQIPVDLSQCEGLLSLNLADNVLEGGIPSSLGEMLLLQELDVSQNQLNGSIPATFSTAPSLVFVNFSYNNLGGQIPALPFANATSASFLGNPQLCGEIIHRTCHAAEHRSRSSGLAGGNATKFGLIGIAAAILVIFLVVLVALNASKQRVPTSPKCNLMKLQLSQIERATDNFSMSNLIGTGASGSVYKGVMLDGQVLAFKKFTMESGSIHAFFRELEATRQAKHKNLVKIFGYWSNHVDDNILILEYMQNGSLEDHLHPKDKESRSCNLTWEKRWHIAISVAEGLDYLHEDSPNSPILHCDIKPSNILFDSEMQAYISDFGLAKIVVDMVTTTTQNLHGTLGYMAPECASSGHISPKCDVYSYGIVMLELMSGIRPTDTVVLRDGMTLMEWAKTKATTGSIQEILDNTMASTYNEGLHNVQIELLMEISLECARENPRDRPTMHQVLARLRDDDGDPMLKFESFRGLLGP